MLTESRAGRTVASMHRRLLAGILLAGLIARVGLFVAVRDTGLQIDDERDYAQIAASLAAGHGFALPGSGLTSKRPPLYPAMIALLWKLSGTQSLAIVRAAQIVVSLATVWLLFLLARRLVGDRAGGIAAAAWCLYPSFLYAGVLILTEVVFTFLLVAACLCATLALDRPRRAAAWAFAAGVSVGLAALTRSVVWPLPLALIPALVVVSRLAWRQRVAMAAALAAGYVLVVAPWAVRNTRLQKTLVIVDTMGGLNLRMGNYEYTPEERMWDGVSLSGDKAWSYAMVTEHPEARHWTEGQRERWARQRAELYMVQHPWTTLRRSVLKFADFWGLEREYIAALEHGAYSPPLWFKVASSAAVIVTYVTAVVLAAFGVVATRWTDWRLHVVPLLVIAWICGVHTAVFGHSRYHLPLMPFVVMYAAAAIDQRAWRTQPSWRPAVAWVAVAILASMWCRELVFRDLDQIRQYLA